MERRNCFEVVSPPDRSLILQAESDEVMNQWISEIQKSISDSLNSQPTPASEERKKIAQKMQLYPPSFFTREYIFDMCLLMRK